MIIWLHQSSRDVSIYKRIQSICGMGACHWMPLCWEKPMLILTHRGGLNLSWQSSMAWRCALATCAPIRSIHLVHTQGWHAAKKKRPKNTISRWHQEEVRGIQKKKKRKDESIAASYVFFIRKGWILKQRRSELLWELCSLTSAGLAVVSETAAGLWQHTSSEWKLATDQLN